MVRNLVLAFIALVALFFVLMYPTKVIEFIQMFIDGAYRGAKALKDVNVHNNN